MTKRLVIIGTGVVLIAVIGVGVSLFMTRNDPYEHPVYSILPKQQMVNSATTSTPIAVSSTTLLIPPRTKTLTSSYHIYQTFNNCGPAALSMTLSYYGIRVSQKALGEELRPYQHPQGNNDDKSVTLTELGEKAKDYGLVPYHRPNGTIELTEKFIAHDIPVIARTWLKVDDDIGHYRIVKGYDRNNNELIQDDSYQNKNLKYSYETFNGLWKKFNYEYLVLVPPEKQLLAEKILGQDVDAQISWEKAAANARKQLEEDPSDIYARFNLSVALYNSGDNQQAIAEFEVVEDKLSFRTLWYQIEPILAYEALGHDDRVITITDKILNNGNRAFSELYAMRGNIYQKQGDDKAAKVEFAKALMYNKNYGRFTANNEALRIRY